MAGGMGRRLPDGVRVVARMGYGRLERESTQVHVAYARDARRPCSIDGANGACDLTMEAVDR
jgi:hypothetical protein